MMVAVDAISNVLMRFDVQPRLVVLSIGVELVPGVFFSGVPADAGAFFCV